MPGIMFQNVVSPAASAHRRWYTLPLSFAIHTAILAVLLVAPLVATDVLPMPRAVLEYTMPTVIPVVAPPPVQRVRQSAGSTSVRPTIGTPVVAPDTIALEDGIITEPHPVATDTIEGLPTGRFGVPAVEALPPPAPAPPSQPLPLGGDIKPPVRTKYVAPVYPEIARRNGVEGIVMVEAIIGVDGRVDSARVMRSHPLLDEAAVQAVRAWEYTPTLLNGRPTPVIMTVTVKFGLK